MFNLCVACNFQTVLELSAVSARRVDPISGVLNLDSMQFRLRRVHFFLRKKETEPKKISPVRLPKDSYAISEIAGRSDGASMAQFHFPIHPVSPLVNLANSSGVNPRGLAVL